MSRESFQIFGRESFLLRHVNDWCTGTRFNFEVANQFIAGGERLVYRDSEWNESLIIIFIAGG